MREVMDGGKSGLGHLGELLEWGPFAERVRWPLLPGVW